MDGNSCVNGGCRNRLRFYTYSFFKAIGNRCELCDFVLVAVLILICSVAVWNRYAIYQQKESLSEILRNIQEKQEILCNNQKECLANNKLILQKTDAIIILLQQSKGSGKK